MLRTWVLAFWFLDLDVSPDSDPWWQGDVVSIQTGAPGTDCRRGFVQPMPRTLVMGDLNVVVAAQEGHFGLLDRKGIRDGCGDLGRSERFPREKRLIIYSGVGP